MLAAWDVITAVPCENEYGYGRGVVAVASFPVVGIFFLFFTVPEMLARQCAVGNCRPVKVHYVTMPMLPGYRSTLEATVCHCATCAFTEYSYAIHSL
jgi:hypothetical protein